jgi:pyruvate/2-oxoglutarate dehydrogenase complex dihydrolipoamide dehydrogenase (E3) component
MSEDHNRKRDLVIIGGGAGGLVVASVAAQLGLDVVLIEKNPQPGGDCLHFGCVPSKALLNIAHVAHTVRHASASGITTNSPVVDIDRVNSAVRRAIDTIAPHDSRERFESLGCEVITGKAFFVSAHSVQVNNQLIHAKKIVLATGSQPFIPDIEGLAHVDYLTNENMFSMPELPGSLLILGAGPVGIEMAQAYARLGSKVTVIETADRILSNMDADIATALAEVLIHEGITLLTGRRVLKVAQAQSDIAITLATGETVRGEKLLVATGRRAMLAGLGLENAGVKYSARGVEVNARMQTSVKHIYACGDVTGQLALTHVAEHQAGVVIANVVFKLPKRIDYRVIPVVVYTDPECAQLGYTENALPDHIKYDVVRFDMRMLDRAITENNTAGFAKLIVRKGRLLGAHILGPRAGDVIHELALAMNEKIKLSRIAALVHAYPSYAQINRRVAGAYYSPSLYSGKTRLLVKWLHRLLP